jgi:hypothetical protein
VAEFKPFVADVEAFVAGFPPELSKIGADLLAARLAVTNTSV